MALSSLRRNAQQKSSRGRTVKHANPRKQTCTHVSWRVHRIERVRAAVSWRRYWLLCPTASISHIGLQFLRSLHLGQHWKKGWVDLNHATTVATHRQVSHFWLFCVTMRPRCQCQAKASGKRGETSLAWLRVTEFKRLLKPLPYIWIIVVSIRRASTLIGVAHDHRVHTRSRTWSYCFSIRVYRWSALTRIDRSFLQRNSVPLCSVLDERNFKRLRWDHKLHGISIRCYTILYNRNSNFLVYAKSI